MKKEEAERKYLEFQKLQREVSNMQEQFMLLEQRYLELKMMNEGLDEIKNESMFIALGNDVFLDSMVKDKNKVLVNIGMNIFVKKDVDNAKKTMGQQMETVREAMDKINDDIKKRVLNLKELQADLKEAS